MGPFDVLVEPRPAAGFGRRRQVPRSRVAPPEGQALPVERSLLGRRHAGRGLGLDEEFRAKDGSSDPPNPGRNGERDFHGEKRANDTHESKTDPDAKLFKKGAGKETKFRFIGHALRGTKRVAFKFTFKMAAYNLIMRLPRLLAAA